MFKTFTVLPPFRPRLLFQSRLPTSCTIFFYFTGLRKKFSANEVLFAIECPINVDEFGEALGFDFSVRILFIFSQAF